MKKILLVVSFALSLVCSMAIASPDNSKVKEVNRVNSCVDSLNASASDVLICEDKGGVITLKVKFSPQDSIDFEESGAQLFWSINGIDSIVGIVRLDSKYVKVTVPTPAATTTYIVKLNPSPVGGCSSIVPTGSVTVVVKLLPTTADAGLSQTGNPTCGLSSINLSAGKVEQGHGTGTWTIDGNSDGGSFADASLFNTSFVGTPGKLYTVRWTVSNAPCAASTDTAQVKLNQNPSTANAGADQIDSKTCGLTTVTLDANVPVVGTGVWTITKASDNNIAGATLVDNNNPKTNISGLPGVTYTLYWTITNAPCGVSFDSVLVKFNQNPSPAVAGADSTGAETCGKTNIALKANIPLLGTGKWSIVSGNGGTVGDVNANETTFDGLADSTYTLRWTVSNSPCTAATDDLVIKFNQNPSKANAGADSIGAEMCGKTSVTLVGNTPLIGKGTWSIVAGIGGTIANDKNTSTAFTGMAETTYTLAWTISNAPCANSVDNVVVTFHTQTDSAKAGPDQTGIATCGKTGVQLSANTPTVGTGVWNIIKGTDGVLIDKNAITTDFNGLEDSTYQVTWTITNSPCKTTVDTITVKFNVNPTTADAGNAQVGPATCGLTTLTLGANVPVRGGGSWSVIKGDTVGISKTMFSDESNPKGTFTGRAGKAYTLQWSISISPCGISTDTVNLLFNEKPKASASDQNLCIVGNSPSTSLNGVAINGTGVWSKISGTGTIAGNTISDVNETTNILKWKVSGFCGDDSVQVSIRFRIQPYDILITGPNSVELCEGGTVLLKALSLDSATANVSFAWYNGILPIANSNSLAISATASGLYSVTATNINGCSTGSNIITVINRDIIDQNLNDTICQGVNYKVHPLYFKGNKYSWSKFDSLGVIGIDSVLTVNLYKKQSYILSIKDSICGLLKPYTFFIDVFPQAELSLTALDSICLGTAVELTAAITKQSAPKYRYAWYEDSVYINGLNDTIVKIWAKPTKLATMYTVEATDSNGCKSRADHVVKAVDWNLNEPNIFTPNLDQINDYFEIRKAPNSTVAIEVYNRWGTQIFQSDDYDNKWDGGGASDGIYYFTMRPSCPNKTIKKWVQIAR